MNYRIATTEDLNILTELRLNMRKERDSNFNEDELRASTLAFFLKNIENKSHIAFVCEHEGQVIGTGGLSLFEMPPTDILKNGRVAKMMNMYTLPAFRGKGVAKEMLKFVMAYAKENEYFKLMLNTSPHGKFLYENAGFTPTNNEYEFFIK